MKHLKISTPAGRNINLSQFTGNQENRIGDWVIHANDRIDEADAWVVLEGAPSDDAQCRIPDGGLVFASAEVIQPDDYYIESRSQRNYLEQFDRILTCHSILADKVERHIPFLPWMINANHGPSLTAMHTRDVNWLKSLDYLDKPKGISVICSTKTYTPEQTLRLRFVERLTSRFAGHIDWFGNGRQSIPEKWDGIAPYKYSIAIENKSAPYVITEKIQDVFLRLAMPIYWGAPNIGDFFESSGFISIDIRDWPGSCQRFEQILDEDPYANSLPSIRENQRRVLEEMNYLNRLVAAVESGFKDGSNKAIRTIRSEIEFAGRGARYRRALGRRLRTLGETWER